MANDRNTFRLGDWLVDPDLCELQAGNGETISVQPKIMDVLLCLVEADGQVVSRHKLVESVWEGRPTSDEPINRCIAELRSALGDDRNNPRYIRTIPKRGYQLLAEVEPAGGATLAGNESLRRNLRRTLAGWVVYIALGFLVLAGWWLWGSGQDVEDSAANAPPRVLVLPLAPLTEDSKLLADALTEEILNSLAQSPDLLVFSRTTTFSISGQDEAPMETARKLKADLVLEGSMRLLDDRLRITAQLVDVQSEIHVFSRDFELVQEQADSLIADLSRMIAAEIGRSLPQNNYHEQLRRLDFVAYRDFVEAGFLHRQHGRDNLDGAMQRLQKVVERYPDFAPAHARLAGVYNSYYWSIEAVPGFRELRDAHLERALALNPDEPLALALRVIGQPHDEVIRVYRQVVAADASLTSVRFGLGMRLARAGYLAEASKELGWLHKREPLQASYAFRQALPLLALEKFDEFSQRRRRLLEMEEVSLAGWLGLLFAMAEYDATAAADAWPAIRAYEAESTGLTAENVGELVKASESEERCRLLDDPELVELQKLPLYWQFLFLSSAPACVESALSMRFESAGSLPNFDIPYLLWLPQTAHLRAHPRFQEFVEQFDFPHVWRELGPPDFCEKHEDGFICH